MKKILLQVLFSVFSTVSVLAQTTEVIELKQLKQDTRIVVNDSQVVIYIDNNEFKFGVNKKADNRVYTLANPDADSNAIYELLQLDKTEINNKYQIAFPNASAVQQLLTKAADKGSEGILLTRLEDGGQTVGTGGELGGKEVGPASDADNTSWWTMVIISGSIGLVAGLLLSRAFRKKRTSPTDISVTGTEKEEPASSTSDTEKAPTLPDNKEKLALQVKSLKEEKKKLQADMKQLKNETQKAISQYSQHEAFLKKYFEGMYREYVKPLNDAIEKNDQVRAHQIIFNLAGHMSSLTKHELGVKQSFDSLNISYVIKEPLADTAPAETITNSTPIDNIPKNIRTITAMMDKAGLHDLGHVIFYGYKIQQK